MRTSAELRPEDSLFSPLLKPGRATRIQSALAPGTGNLRFSSPIRQERSAVNDRHCGRLLTWLVLGTLSARTTAAEKIDFSRDVRPILSSACFSCHGPDEKNRKAKLRLDTPDGSRKVIVPGKPSESELIARI